MLNLKHLNLGNLILSEMATMAGLQQLTEKELYLYSLVGGLTRDRGGSAGAEVVLLDALALVVAGHQLRHLVESVERVPVEEVFLGGLGRLHPRGKVDRVALGHLEQVAGTRKN